MVWFAGRTQYQNWSSHVHRLHSARICDLFNDIFTVQSLLCRTKHMPILLQGIKHKQFVIHLLFGMV